MGCSYTRSTVMNLTSRQISLSSLIALTLVFPAYLSAPLPPQSLNKFETNDSPRIIINNAFSVTITPWDYNRVTIDNEVSGPTIPVDEIKLKRDKNRFEITCIPSKPDRNIYLMLKVPKKAFIELRNKDNKLEVKDPTGIVKVVVNKNLIEANVPETSSVDATLARNASENRSMGRDGFSEIRVDGRRSGSGPPFIKIIAPDIRVAIWRGAERPGFIAHTGSTTTIITGPVRRKPTIASTTIARRNSEMSRRLRQSNPDLIRPRRDDSPAALASESDEESVKLETHLVNLNVSATDRDGKAIRGLTKGDFSVYEDGVLQQISFFSPEESPFNLVLLIDLSGSMRDEIELIKETAIHFLDTIGTNDTVAVITFSTDITVVSPLTKDRDDLKESVDWMLPPTGGTSFYDSLGYVLVETLRKVKGQRNAVISITDGEDNALSSELFEKARPEIKRPPSGSFLTFEQLLEGATESDALIYPIHLNPAPQQVVIATRQNAVPVQTPLETQIQPLLTETAKKQLNSLADATGARFYHADRIADLKGVFQQVAAELRTVYSLAYTPTNKTYDGKFRKIKVQANSADIVLRTRPGYFGK
jgi:VWFA-related protein